MKFDLSMPAKQADLAALVGVSQPAVSKLIADGKLPATGTLGALLLAYCQNLREQAAQRHGPEADDRLDLVQERAALAREQRESQAMKNAITRAQYAPSAVLEDILSIGSRGLAEQIMRLESTLSTSLPELPESAHSTIAKVLASARTEWLRSTAKLVDTQLSDAEDGSGGAENESEGV